jgi:hypothetical protein
MNVRLWRWLMPLWLILSFAVPLSAHADTSAKPSDSVQVMEAFQSDQRDQDGANRALTDKDKRRVLFMLGIPLLICLLITAGLGIAMGVYGKPVFKAHMIFAGAALSLAGAHVVAALVWFYPF